VLDIVEATVLLGADPTKARTWWLGEISRIANDQNIAVTELAITPADVAELVALVAAGELTDKLDVKLWKASLLEKASQLKLWQSAELKLLMMMAHSWLQLRKSAPNKLRPPRRYAGDTYLQLAPSSAQS
jgi:Asp-tRNA(Asn)/Glu-tRNA(Gln) amidotransferase B subunit